MKKKLLVSFLLAASITTASAVSAFAADVKVLLDGKEVDYSSYGVYPQIIDDYTMVPIRQTAELMGMDINVSDFPTIKFSKGDLNATHVLHTDAVTINGKPEKFDTNSKIVNDYTLMPIRMVASIINAEVAWYEESYTVGLTSKVVQPVITPATVNSAYVNNPTAYVGEEFLITVSASENTESVRLLDSTGNVLSTSTSYIDFNGYRTFSLSYTPQVAMITSMQYQVQAGNASGFNTSDGKFVSVKVEEPIALISASADKSTVTKNDTATIRVVGNDKTTNARLIDTSTNKEYSPSSSSSVSDGNEFVFKIKITEIGKTVFDVYLTNGTNYKDTDKSVTITVEEKKDKLEIKKIEANKDIVDVGDEVKFTIRTSLSTEEVEVYNENDKLVDTLYKSTESSSYRTFTTTLEMKSSGTNEFTFYAYDNDGNRVKDTYEISPGSKISLSGYLLRDCVITRDGRYYIFTIYTSNDVKHVSINDEYGDELGYSSRYDKTSGNQLVWEIKLTASQVEYQNIEFVAQDDYGEYETYTYTLNTY